MNIFVTLDYELFFGKSGSVEHCLIKPTDSLLESADEFNIKLNFFVDAGYLVKLQELKKEAPQLQKDYQKVKEQIQRLVKNGHRVELHIHPHWEDSYFKDNEWVFNTTRYKLNDFTKSEARIIVLRYTQVLEEITGRKPVAFRAGGWSIQPFVHIKDALAEQNIFIDSSVFPQGYHDSENQYFDFRKVPQFCTHYNFSNFVDKEEKTGEFTEIPISSYKVSPLFFWRFAFKKIFKSKEHQAFGDGYAVPKPKSEVLRMLTKSSYSVVSIDGYKAKYLKAAYRQYKKRLDGKDNFVIIGHPKAFTPYALNKTKEFFEQTVNDNSYKTF